LPILIYAWTMVSNSVNIPHYDDYDVILSFLNQYVSIHDVKDSLSLLLKRESDHIPFFPRLVFLTDCFFNQHINFSHIIFVANACLLGILGVFYRSCLFGNEEKIRTFLPVTFLLFQMQYWEITTWAVTAIIFYTTFLFSILTIFYLNKRESFYLPFAFVMAVIATFSAGNGLLVLPSGALLLLIQRRFKETLIWILLSISLILVYGFLYASQGNDSISPAISTFLQHPLSFLFFSLAAAGSSGGLGIKIFSVAAGLFIFSWFFYLTYKKYYDRNPVIYFFMLFLLLTSMAIALKRNSFGVDLILFTSRYRLVSTLLLVTTCISLLELCRDNTKRLRLSRNILVFATILFILSYILYLPFISGKHNEVKTGINGLLHNNPARAYDIIQTAVENHIYEPPKGFLDNIGPDFKRNAETKLHNFSTRFNERRLADTTLTLRINIAKGNIFDTTLHILLQKPEVIYLFNSGLTPTTIREVLHNVNPDYYKSDICINNNQP